MILMIYDIQGEDEKGNREIVDGISLVLTIDKRSSILGVFPIRGRFNLVSSLL